MVLLHAAAVPARVWWVRERVVLVHVHVLEVKGVELVEK